MAAKTPAALRARRMLALLRHLRPDAEIALDTLAANLGASSAELTGDIELLSLCGSAPYTPDVLVSAFVEEDGVVRAYQSPPALDRPVRLTLAEARALVAALETAGASADDPLVTKLMAAAAAEADPGSFARIVRTSAAPGGALAVYEALAEAIDGRTTVRIDYWTAGQSENSQRVIRPYALAFDRGAWYVSAYCERAEGDRCFRVDRIREATPAGGTFERPAAVPAATPSFSAADMPVAEVLFSSEEDFAERDWPGATAERRAGGGLLARVPYASPGWIARRVAARFGTVEVLSPAEVRAAVRAISGEGC